MDFNRFDLSETFGKSKANSIFVKLRKEELGYFKMKQCENSLCSIVFFNPDEIIKHYQHKKEKYISDPFLVARPLYIEAWDNMIRIAKHFKVINNDT